MDGQTKRQNQKIKQYLRAACSYKQDHCVELLTLAEYAYNSSIHHSTLMTPFLENYNYHHMMHF